MAPTAKPPVTYAIAFGVNDRAEPTAHRSEPVQAVAVERVSPARQSQRRMPGLQIALGHSVAVITRCVENEMSVSTPASHGPNCQL